MKALFSLLVVVNLLVFGWEYQRQQQPIKRDVQQELQAGVKRLQLVSEQDGQAIVQGPLQISELVAMRGVSAIKAIWLGLGGDE